MSRIFHPRVLQHSPLFRPPQTLLHRRFLSTPPPASPRTLGARMKALSKEYGYAALGVYLALSALDFPFCFLGVRLVGAEKIAEYEEVVVTAVRPYWVTFRERVGVPVEVEQVGRGGSETEVREIVKERRDERDEKGASVWTELVLAYAIHKSLIFLRVPVTAAVTPKVVKVFRRWGWDVGKKGGFKITGMGKRE